MASLMPMCAGLVGPRSENVKISSASVRPKWAYKQQTHISAKDFACPKKALALQESEPKEQRSDRSEKTVTKRGTVRAASTSKKWICWFKMLRLDF